MAVYSYQCDACGLRFEKRKKMAQHADPEDCPECRSEARKLVTAANFSFKHGSSQVRGPLPPSTGTSDDWNIDKAIGRDAAAKWEKIEERQAHKNKVLREAHKQGLAAESQHLVRTREGAGEYRLVKEPERQEINARREAVAEITKKINAPSGE